MVYKVTAKFHFDNGQVKKIDWIEPNLVKKDSDEFLTLNEAEMHFRSLFLRYMSESGVLTVPNIMGKVSVIPFSKLYYAEVSVVEYSANDAGAAVSEKIELVKE